MEIGWHKVPELAIELKDEGVALTRQSLGGGSGEAQFVIRRVTINGESEINDVTVPQRQLATRTVVLDDRAYLTEADILSGNVCDLDWKWLVTDATEKLGLELKDIRTVGYTVERVTKGADGSTSNSVVGCFSRQFNTQRSKPVVKAPAQDKPVYAARPTFAFSSSDDTMTAYEIQVFAANGVDKVWDSGVRILPARQGLGVGEYAYTVTPALYADCAVTTNGSTVFHDGSNYVWRVALMNAKFNDTSDPACWSEFGKFQMDVGNKNRYAQFATGYGSVAAAVRYYGPTNVLAGMIVVEAFENADFTGEPVARTRIADVAAIDSITDITTTNAFLKGIEPGTVYLRAYIDQNNNGKRDNWESWGYVNSVGKSVAAIYNPVGVGIVDSLVQVPTCTIYIEDCDLNGNEIPDCLESEKFTGGGDSSGALDGDKDGLTDDEENGFGTDSTLWDTDGDGMPDGWEMEFAGLDPRFYDADEVTDGDWMAYAEVEATLVTVQNTDDPADVTVYVLGEDVAKKPVRGDTAVGLPLFETYTYEVSVGGELQDRFGLGKEVTLAEEAGKLYRVTQVSEGKIVLVHAQVYDMFGYESGVAVSSNEHTKAFTALDKYLVVRYLEAIGLASEETMNLNLTPGQQWKDLTLKPLDPDNDKDGIADGWELYVMFGPNGVGSCALAEAKISPWNFNDARLASPDGDGLTLLDEYDGGHLPTDPWSVDTDRDGIADAHAYAYHLKGERYREDDDNDGLSNFQEFLSSVALTNSLGTPVIAADRMKTYEKDGQIVPDYFLRVGSLYLGEILGDHDFIEDWLEDSDELFVGDRKASRYQYDAHRDADGNGWDNWSEARAFLAAGRANVVDIVTNGTAVVTNLHDVSAYTGRPTPTGRIKVVYSGEKYRTSLSNVVVQAYRYRDGKAPSLMVLPDAKWTMPMTGVNDWYELSTPTSGFVCGGKNVFAVFSDVNCDGVWTPGEPYGVLDAVDVGYASIPDSVVEVTDCNSSMMRLDLAGALAANEFAAQAALNDRGVNGLSSEANVEAKPNAYQNPLDTTTRVRVRLVRHQVNRQTSNYNAGDRKTYYVGEVLMDRYVDVSLVAPLTEAVLLEQGVPDLDWGTGLPNLCYYQNIKFANLGSIAYALIVGDEDWTPDKALSECNCLSTVFVNAFEIGDEQTKAAPLSVSFEGEACRPTFRWRHDQKRKFYPAFRLRIWDGATLVYDSGVQRAPVRDAHGVYQWTAPAYVGNQLENGKDYEFSVSMLDAKFMTPNTSETKMPFRAEANGVGGALSDQYSIFTAVKYFGPVETNKPIRVEAFASPDFAGLPVSATTVKNVATLMETNAVTCNAQLIGLQAGKPYYVRAYIDSNENGVKDAEESWGYGNYVGTTRKDLYTPRAYVASKGSFLMPEAVVYIEDVDRNNNGLPDVAAVEANAPAAVAANPYVVTYDGTSASVTNVFAAMGGDAALLPYVSQLNSFANGGTLSAYQMYYAMAMYGLNPASLETEPVARITSFDLARGIEIALETPTTVNGETLLAKKQGMTVSVSLNVTVWHVADLTGTWAPVGAPIAVTVPVNACDGKVPTNKLKEINDQIASRTGASGFYKVTVEVAP